MTTPPVWQMFMQKFFEAPEGSLSLLLLYKSLTGRCGSSPTSTPGLSFHSSSLQGWLMQYPIVVGYLCNRQFSSGGQQQDGSSPNPWNPLCPVFPWETQAPWPSGMRACSYSNWWTISLYSPHLSNSPWHRWERADLLWISNQGKETPVSFSWWKPQSLHPFLLRTPLPPLTWLGWEAAPSTSSRETKS